MSSQSSFRAGGVALLLGCALVGLGSIGEIVFSGASQISTVYALVGWIGFIGVVLLNLGLPALYARIAGRVGVTGLVGYTLVQIFFLLEIVDYFVSTVIIPYVQAKAPHIGKPPVGLFIAIFLVGPLLGVIGGIVLGIALLRLGARLGLYSHAYTLAVPLVCAHGVATILATP